MDAVEVILGGIVFAAILLVASVFCALVVTGYIRLNAPKIDQAHVAFVSSGLFPIGSGLVAAAAVLDSTSAGFSEAELTSIPMFGLGATLALLLAWPAAHRLTKWVYKIGRAK